MRRYVALIHKDHGSDYGVSFPDFPGCITAGSTMEEARKMASEALTGHIEVMRHAGEAIPVPSDPDKVLADPENRGAHIAFVEVTGKLRR
jgi:predicted RNase H-like HicB family nuclease